MTTFKITSSAGQDLGTYAGKTQADALDAMARSLGLEPRTDVSAMAEPFRGTVEDIEENVNGESYTFSEWLAATGRQDTASQYDLRAAWRAGEDPEEYAV